jgi:hypothetical protein
VTVEAQVDVNGTCVWNVGSAPVARADSRSSDALEDAWQFNEAIDQAIAESGGCQYLPSPTSLRRRRTAIQHARGCLRWIRVSVRSERFRDGRARPSTRSPTTSDMDDAVSDRVQTVVPLNSG